MSNLVRNTAVSLVLLFGSTAVFANDHLPDCPKTSGNNALKLTIDEYHLSLNNKKPICIPMGGSVNVRIHQPGNSTVVIEQGDVTAAQKDGAPFIISGINADDEYLTLTATPFPNGGGDETSCDDGTDDECAKFWIKVKGVGELDPKVRVVDGGVETSLKQKILQEVLEDLDLTIEEAVHVLNYQPEGAK